MIDAFICELKDHHWRWRTRGAHARARRTIERNSETIQRLQKRNDALPNKAKRRSF